VIDYNVGMKIYMQLSTLDQAETHFKAFQSG
jgi:hypothetical protein